MTTPTYLPAAQDASSYLAPYIPKYNYQQLPPQPQTNQDQTLLSPCMVDVANLGQTCPKFSIQFTTATTTGALSFSQYKAMWINATNTSPVLIRNTTGVFTIDLPTLVSHEYTANLSPPVLNNIPVVITQAFVSAVSFGSAPCFFTATTNNNLVTITLLNSSNAAIDNAGTVINVVGI
jgi:hypothetical protein